MPPPAGQGRSSGFFPRIVASSVPRHLGCPTTSTSNATGANNRSIGQKCFRCELLSTARGPPAVRSGLVKCSVKCSSLDRPGHHCERRSPPQNDETGQTPKSATAAGGLAV